MPELPEVQTIASDLQVVLPKQILTSVKILWAKSLNVSALRLKKVLVGRPVKNVYRLGKSLIIDFGEQVLHIHLKMTGQLVWCSARLTLAGGHPIIGVGEELPNKFTRVVFNFEAGQLFFNDVRKFGWIKLLSVESLSEYKKKLGLEPFGTEFTLKNFNNNLKRKSRSKIKAALLDQSIVVGLGNIYVDEVLFASKIRPEKLVGKLKLADYQNLFKNIQQILKLAIKHRGTSFSDYRDARGSKGKYLKYLKVYGRGGQPCLACGKNLEKQRIAGRGTHWCKNCQS